MRIFFLACARNRNDVSESFANIGMIEGALKILGLLSWLSTMKHRFYTFFRLCLEPF